MRGLVVGRFQPLHNGHVRLIKTAIEDCVHVVVAIGSTDPSGTYRNPFTADERKQMLEAVFGDDVEVVLVPDIHDPPRWVVHLLSITGRVDKVYGNDDRTLDLFEDAGIAAVRPGLIDRQKLEGATVRMQIAEGDPAWRKSVPAPAVELLESWEAARRLRLLGAAA